MEQQEEEAPILASTHYYWGNCFICKRPNSKENPLKRCTRCRSLYYCSKEHQAMHWKTHKKLCKYLAAASDSVGQYNFFSGKANAPLEEWKKFRMDAALTCQIVQSRQLEVWEMEVFLFPKACRICHAVQESMRDCQDCLGVSYCSEQHQEEDLERHARTCRKLQIAMMADTYESFVKVGIPAIPSHLDNVYYGTSKDITDFFNEPLVVGKSISKDELEHCFLTCQLSGPLTLLDSLDRFQPSMSEKEELTIHIVGAAVYEMLGLIKWEYLLHRLPKVKRIEFTFIGPALDLESQSAPQVPVCSECENLGRHVKYNVFCARYEEFLVGFKNVPTETGEMKKEVLTDTEKVIDPDLVLVQNCGFSEFNDDNEIKGWQEGWKHLNQLLPRSTSSLLIFTSYTRGEAEGDLQRFLKYTPEAEVLLESALNPMRSHRPVRDWETDCNMDVFYYNQFFSVIRRKSE